MGSLKRAISYLLGNELHRNQLKLTSMKKHTQVHLESLVKLELREILENKNEKFPAKDSLVLLLKFMNKDLNWQTALRSLMIIHRLIHDIGESFTQELYATKIKLFADFKRHTSPLRTLVHSTLIPIYTNYIQRLSYNYESLKVCFAKSDIQDELKANDLTLFHFITRIQNILMYLLKVTQAISINHKLIPFLETSFIHFDNIQLMKQLTYFVMTDCFNYYKYINDLLEVTLKRIFDLKSEDAFFLYEIYCENIKITKKVQVLFNLRNHVDEFEIIEPTLFEIDVDFNKKLEFYMTKLRSEYSQKSEELKPIRNRIKLEYTESESAATEESDNPEKLTIEDLSKMIFSPSTAKTQTPIEIFKAPMPSKRGNTEREIPPVEETKEVSELCQIVVHKAGQADTAVPVKQIFFNKKEEISRDPSPVNRDSTPIQINSD